MIRPLVLCFGLCLCVACDETPRAGETLPRDAAVTRDAGNEPDEDAGRDAERPPSDGGPDDAAVAEDAGRGEPDAAGPDLGPDAGAPYFDDLDESLRDQALVLWLHDKLARDHRRVAYDDLFLAYADVDAGRDGCADIFDFYSTQCWKAEDACGSYAREGDCVNREHLWPKSWWGGASGPDQHQDLISVLPTDGYVNGIRGNLPLGATASANYTSRNGSRRGPCSTTGAPTGSVCFEPPDTLKGDFARIYFYEAVRYEGEFTCCDDEAVNGADLKPWLEAELRTWHVLDPVDEAERTRNERVFGWQNNRNPFVDLPELVERIADF